jgi:hypothetical protein
MKNSDYSTLPALFLVQLPKGTKVLMGDASMSVGAMHG